MSKNVMEPDKPQMVIWWRVSCWISKATRVQAHASSRAPTGTRARTHTEICNTYHSFTAVVVSWTNLIITVYIQCRSCISVFSHFYASSFSFPPRSGDNFALLLHVRLLYFLRWPVTSHNIRYAVTHPPVVGVILGLLDLWTWNGQAVPKRR